MIFNKPLVGRVARGEITLTVRPATARRKVGARHCVQSRQGGPIACHIIITDVRECLAGDVGFREVRAAGYRTTDAFRVAWVERHDKQWIERMGTDMPEPAVLERFLSRHHRKPVHVIAFVLAADTPRYMATAPVAGRSGDYVTSPAMSIDPTAECVDEATQERLSQRAREAGEQQREAFRRELEAERARRKAERGRAMRRAA